MFEALVHIHPNYGLHVESGSPTIERMPGKAKVYRFRSKQGFRLEQIAPNGKRATILGQWR